MSSFLACIHKSFLACIHKSKLLIYIKKNYSLSEIIVEHCL